MMNVRYPPYLITLPHLFYNSWLTLQSFTKPINQPILPSISLPTDETKPKLGNEGERKAKKIQKKPITIVEKGEESANSLDTESVLNSQPTEENEKNSAIMKMKRRVSCDICSKSFCDKGALKIHTSAVHLREMHTCTVSGCGKQFSSRRSRNRHSSNSNPKLHLPESISHTSPDLLNPQHQHLETFWSNRFLLLNDKKDHPLDLSTAA